MHVKFMSSSVPVDISAIFKKKFAPGMAGLATSIFNKIIRSGLYPRQWVTEFVTPILKYPLMKLNVKSDLIEDYELKRINPIL